VDEANFYTLGGAVSSQREGLYLTRKADEELLQSCRKGELAYVFGPRQIGKTSLVTHVARQLATTKVRIAFIDLSMLGTNQPAERWYLDLILAIADRLKIKTDLVKWWKENAQGSAIQRLHMFFEKVLLARVKKQVLIFIDEVDAALNRNDFLSLIRSFHDMSAMSPGLKRMSFVLVGLVPPDQLQPDIHTSPFINAARVIELTDFSEKEALPLADGLGLPTQHARQVLEWVLEWTGGHPYLTQRLCSAIAEKFQSSWSQTDVEKVAAETFFGDKALQDSNLIYISNVLTKSLNANIVLGVYQGILKGMLDARPAKLTADERQALSLLLVSGVVVRKDADIQVRNRIYREVFNDIWLASQMTTARLNPLERLDLEPGERDVARSFLGFLVTSAGVRITLTASDLASFAQLPPENIAPVLERLVRFGVLRLIIPEREGQLETRYEIVSDSIASQIQEWLADNEQIREETEQEAASEASGEIDEHSSLTSVRVYVSGVYPELRQEREAVKNVLSEMKEKVFEGVEYFMSRQNKEELSLWELERSSVYICIVGESYVSGLTEQEYRRAEELGVPCLIYVKEQGGVSTNRDERANESLKAQSLNSKFFEKILAKHTVSYFKSSHELAVRVSTDLRRWLYEQGLPALLKSATQAEVPADVGRSLLSRIKDSSAINPELLARLRAHLPETETRVKYWFYFSYARPNLDEYLRQFYLDLSRRVRELTGDAEHEIGFFDHDIINQGERWSDAIVDALQTSRVFVSLYTPAYFRSEFCGKEWQLFDAMSEASRTDSSQHPMILPVLWSAPSALPEPLPEAASNIQYAVAEYGTSYLEEGLRYLMQRAEPQYRYKYEEFLFAFAKRLVEVARTYEIRPLPARPQLESVRSAFHQADTPETDRPDRKLAPQRRYVLVAGTGKYGLQENVHKVSQEVGKALARNGYGLIVGGWSGVDYVVTEAFASELRNTDRSLSDYLIQVVPVNTQPQFQGGKVIQVEPVSAEFSEQIKYTDAVILIGGLGGTYGVYNYARQAQKPVFPVAGTGTDALKAYNEIVAGWETQPPENINVESFYKLGQSLETDLDVQKVTEVLLELIDGLWARPRSPMSRNDALARVIFVKGNLLDQPVDALVNAVGINPQSSGAIGEALLEIFGPDFYTRLDFQKMLMTGETLVSEVGDRLPARYVIHTCSETTSGTHTLTSISQAVTGALTKAEQLDVRTIAFPSIGTGAAGFEASSVAPKVLETVMNYMAQGSGLEKVVFAFIDNDSYRAYLDAYRKIGGISLNVLLPRLSASSRHALGFAEALRQRLDYSWINTRLLLWGLYQKHNGAARTLLTAISSPVEIDMAFQQLMKVRSLTDIEPVRDSALVDIKLSPHCQQALIKALELAGDTEVIRERQVLAGLLGIARSRATRWIAQISGLNIEQLWDVVAVEREDEGQTIAPQVRSLLARQSHVRTELWSLRLSEPQVQGQSARELRVGEKQIHTLDLQSAMPTDDERERQLMLRIPANALEITGYIKAHGFHLHGDNIFTIPVENGRPIRRSITFELTPLMSGPRTVQVEVYPGGRIPGLLPSVVSRNFSVASPVALPDIKELIDRRRIPNPQPDVMLYVALEEHPDGQRTRIYLTCPMLQLDRELLEPLMLNKRDLAELRRMAIHTAASATHISPQDLLAAMRGFGAMLFEKIMPGSLQEHYYNISQLAAASPIPWSWLIISDENAILPWELLCYYAVDPETGISSYDNFLADKFLVAHWVGQRGLRLVSEAPIGKLDLIHYAQYPGELPQWLTALGGDEFVQAEEESGHISLLQPGSYFYGLHLLRYTEQRRSDRIVSANRDVETGQERAQNEAEDITYEQRLDLTLHRPTIGLSFINTLPLGRVAKLTEYDTRLESNWMIPLMHAGASALIGSRWPVSQESDMTFVQQFYQAMRSGEPLGIAVWLARQQVRAAFPHRPDWLAYTYFGHPQCEPYLVRPAKGFTLFEAIDQPDDLPFLAGSTYRFRASYRKEAPAWYNGRLRVQEGSLQSDDVSIVVMPLSGIMPQTYALTRVPQSDDLQCTVPLTMPEKKTTLPVMVRFQEGNEELRTITLNLQIEEGLAR
jgi:O-acetyl-ADP-ribose deacetylase (regulator of RNase III)